MTRYVQHQSGAGQMWEVRLSISDAWQCYDMATNNVYFLPKSEYVEVPAPDRWVDITAACGEIMDGPNRTTILYEQTETMGKYDVATIRGDYRLRKVPICTGNGADHEATKQWAFIVERKEPS